MPLVNAATPPSFPRGLNREIVAVAASETLTANHRDRTLKVAATSTITLPSTLPVGFHCKVEQHGSGQVTFAAGSNATLVGRGSFDRTIAQYSVVDVVVVTNTDGISAEYVLSGDMTDSTGLTTSTVGELNLLDDAVSTTVIGLAAGATDTMTITVTVTDAAGATIDAVHALECWISEAATGIGLTADSYSGDVTTTTGTELQEIVSKKHYTYLTAATGVLVVSAVDTANPADQYFVVKHPLTGKLTVSAASGTSWGA